MDHSGIILPGSWLGVFGGGQLGRMFAHAAQRLGYHVAIVDQDAQCPAAQVADRAFVIAQAGNEAEVIAQLARACSAITLEFENVSAAWLRQAEEFTLVRPGANFLELCQDRLREKSSLSSAGFPTTPFASVVCPDDIRDAVQSLGWPLVLKTASSGYDGKGQIVVRNQAEIDSAWKNLGTDRAIAEKMIHFQAEVSLICARNARGQMIAYPLLENEHAHHILDVTRCPARPEFVRVETEAREIAFGIASHFEVQGLFCVEFFVATNGKLLINEIAPRPHNSGHLTIEAFSCSQFEQQVRAVCNLPLQIPNQIAPAAMANLLGDLWASGPPAWERVLASRDARLHLYGKATARNGRKMGHLTCLAESSDRAAEIARSLRGDLVRRDIRS